MSGSPLTSGQGGTEVVVAGYSGEGTGAGEVSQSPAGGSESTA